MTDTAPRVEGVSGVPGDDVEVQVVDCLARGRAGVEAHVVAIWLLFPVEDVLDGVDELNQPEAFLRRRIPPCPDQATGNHESVPGAHREPVRDRKGGVVAHEPLLGRNLEERGGPSYLWCSSVVLAAGHGQTLCGPEQLGRDAPSMASSRDYLIGCAHVDERRAAAKILSTAARSSTQLCSRSHWNSSLR